MYVPPAFREDDLPTIHAEMQKIQLATLVTLTENGLVATHLPLLLDSDAGEFGTLYGHLARGNLQWRETMPSVEALAIFTASDAYVTPSWYPSKLETGKVVPTWMYAAIHAYGAVKFIDDAEWLRDLVSRLTDKHEASFPQPWKVTDAPGEYVEAQLKRIIGVELPISRLEAKWKFDQRSLEADRLGVVTALEASSTPGNLEAAGVMRRIEEKRKG
ncbi:Transcriptional regulator [Acidisarcina polymorpha]|uniref:Transcriptional regulator n=1 Tax=Acidisarcina polymorpha TaxID=2211140 RepID=A0A2Z5G8V8_9BACT|nr:FMN-binding negative transcriptional regulator [Acidisarcina polymorpha]AXC15227.1 Transcriptional regulator [Acidisarcina polymorpha]